MATTTIKNATSPRSKLDLLNTLEGELLAEISRAEKDILAAKRKLEVISAIKADQIPSSKFCTKCSGKGEVSERRHYGHDSNEWNYEEVICTDCEGSGLKRKSTID